MTTTIIFRLHPLMSSHWCCLMSRTLSLNSEYSTTTRRWHVTISCQPDGLSPQPVRRWKSGRVHLAESSNVVVLELAYSTEFGRESRKFANGVRRYLTFDAPCSLWWTRKKQILSSLSTANIYRLSRVKVSGTCVQPFRDID